MIFRFTIEGRLPNLNDLISCERVQFKTRTGRFATKGSVLKKKWQKHCVNYIRKDLKNLKLDKPVTIHYHYFEIDKRRDLGNIHAFAQKVIEDALQESGVLKNDNWQWVKGFTADFDVDKTNPRIVVELDTGIDFDYENATEEEKLAYTE